MKYNFLVGTIRPDQRVYRQQSIELHTSLHADLYVQIEISDKNVIETVPDEEFERTLISLAGLREIMDRIDGVFLSSAPEDDGFEETETKELDEPDYYNSIETAEEDEW